MLLADETPQTAARMQRVTFSVVQHFCTFALNKLLQSAVGKYDVAQGQSTKKNGCIAALLRGVLALLLCGSVKCVHGAIVVPHT